MTDDSPIDPLAETGNLGRLSKMGPPPKKRRSRTMSRQRAAEALPRRFALALTAVAVVLTGLLVHFRGNGEFSALVADALYAVLVYLVIALIAPTVNRLIPLGLALVICSAIELFQLTGIPRALAEAVPASALVLGSGFNTLDLVAYAVGAVAIAALDSVAGWMWRPRPVTI